MSTYDTPSIRSPWLPDDADLANAEADVAVEEFLYDLAVTEATISEVERRLDNPRHRDTGPLSRRQLERLGIDTTDLAEPGTSDIDLSNAAISDEDALAHWPGV